MGVNADSLQCQTTEKYLTCANPVLKYSDQEKKPTDLLPPEGVNAVALQYLSTEKVLPVLKSPDQEQKPSDLLPPADVAGIFQVTVGTLAVWRCTGRYSLPFVKIGSKVFYRRSDISSFIESRIQTQTA